MALGNYTEIITRLTDAHQIQGVVAWGSLDIHKRFSVPGCSHFSLMFMSGKFGVRHVWPIAPSQEIRV